MAVHNISSEQFKSMLSVLTSEQRESFLSTALAYHGAKDSAVLQTFLTCTAVYKALEKVDDEELLNKMSNLLKSDAAVWWSKNKDNIKTFTDFEAAIKKAFLKKQPYEIFQEIFKRQEANESTENYVNKKRALFAQLPDTYKENVQLDIIYCFLNLQMKEKIARESIETFEGLVMAATEFEQDPSFQKRKKKRCNFCRMTGHDADECLKRARLVEEARERDYTSDPTNSIVTKVFKKDVAIQMPHPNDPKYYCAGCDMPNMVRSKCPVCRLKPLPEPNPNISFC